MTGLTKVLACTCRGTMPYDPTALGTACGAGPAAHELCRAEIGRFTAALGDGKLLVACTQEAPAFRLAQEAAGDQGALGFFNVREAAGWADEAAAALPKIAALAAEARALAVLPAPRPITFTSAGVTLVIGVDERALAAAEQLKDRLDLTVMLTGEAEVMPVAVADYPVVCGRVVRAAGHLGAFELAIDGYARALPSSRGAYAFEATRDGVTSRCDVVVDLTGGTPMFPAHAKRDGYLRPDPDSPAAVQAALLAATELTGTFDKPRYVTLDSAKCAHSRNGRVGCTRCLDACPTGAIGPAGDHVTIDAATCAGCGSCSAVCPTEAIAWAVPDAAAMAGRLRAALLAYTRAGGTEPPVLLLHDRSHGVPLIEALARAGSGLPAWVIPVCEPRVLGLDALGCAIAFGAAEVRVLSGRGSAGDREAQAREAATLDGVLDAMGFGTGRVAMLDADDPFDLGAQLAALPRRPAVAVATFLPVGGTRAVALQAMAALFAAATPPPEAVALPAGASFGRIHVAEGCTLCLACVSVCPTSALRDGGDRPALLFVEDACVQCGLCRATCPEHVIALEPRLTVGPLRREAALLREEAPALCVECGKAFGVRSSIERVAAKLLGQHWMFADPAIARRLWMCADCRVVAQVRQGMDPYAGGPRPRTRTAEDP